MLKGYRTILASLALATVGVLEAADWTDIIPDGPNKGYVLLGISIVMAWLRVITDTPIFQDKEDESGN